MLFSSIFETNHGEIVKYAICLHLVIVLDYCELRWLLFTCLGHHHGCPTRKYPFPFEKDALGEGYIGDGILLELSKKSISFY